MKKILPIAAFLMLIVTVVSIWLTRGDTMSDDLASEQGSIDDSSPAAIGGMFSLTDANGNKVTDATYRGKIMLVFFGFTNCPDICPVTVATMGQLLEDMGDKAEIVAPVFITVDPERDTPEVMKEYLGKVDSRIIGLTGTAEEITQAASAYKVYYSRSASQQEDMEMDSEEEGDGMDAENAADAHDAHAGHDNSTDYNVDHSGFIYLMDKEGKYIRHFSYDAPAEEILEAIESIEQ